MNKQYDFIYLTNTPSFYKARLCEELAKKHSVLLVLYGYGAEAVNTRLSGNENGFDYFFLHEGDAGKRNKALVLFRLLKLMARVRARRVLFSGWMAPEYNIYSFLSSKRRNAVICESSAIDSGMKGWKGLLKKAVIRRMSAALPSGSPHRALFEHIRYPGDIHVTGSVGTHFHPGNNVGIGKDDTLFAKVDGILRFETKHGGRKCVSVYPEEIAG